MVRISAGILLGCFLLNGGYTMAQRVEMYTLLQARGMMGIGAPADLSTNGLLPGYGVHLILGRNISHLFYTGVGIGNEVYRGKTPQGHSSRLNLLPVYADFRRQIVPLPAGGHIGLMANAGYAPRIAANFSKGFLCSGGLTYGYPLSRQRSDLLLTAAYGLQQLDTRLANGAVVQQTLSLTVGLFLY